MYKSHLTKTIGGAILGFFLMLGIGATPNATVSAQYQDNRGRQERRDRNDNDAQRRRDRDYSRDRNRLGRNDDGYGNYGGSFQLRQTALNEGFNQGLKEGRKDRQRGERYDYTDEGAFQNATESYNSRLGDRETYKLYFREAFSHGYADGYGGY